MILKVLKLKTQKIGSIDIAEERICEMKEIVREISWKGSELRKWKIWKRSEQRENSYKKPSAYAEWEDHTGAVLISKIIVSCESAQDI